MKLRLIDIEVNPWQPRSKFDDDSIQELAESIREIGIIQPITVRLSENGKYQLITGERRYRAAMNKQTEYYTCVYQAMPMTRICLKWRWWKISNVKTWMLLK
jgi:ParB/RepB/Spo0J family partition protein